MNYWWIFIVAVLLYIIIYQNIKIYRISHNIEQIIKGNFNGRIRIQDSNKNIKSLIIQLNRLIDEFQKIVSLNKQYEEDRKKMISNISHDFRTPLTSMLGYVEMMKNDSSLSDKERIEYLEVVRIKGEILRNLVEEFFSLSKIDSEDIVLNPKILNITEIIRQCTLSFLKDFEGKSMEPILELPDKEIFLEADEKAIYRILQNLIANALKYGEDGKVIGIDLEEKEQQIIMKIWDKGRGIPEEEIHHIFKRLYSLDKSRNSNQKGSGLGLTIVKKLVEEHSGTIEVSSKPYEETVLKVILPKKLRNM